MERMFDSALLIDLTTKATLYNKEPELSFAPTGSAVNLMCAYIVSQEADWEQEIPIIDAVYELAFTARKIDLVPGRRWLVKDLVAGMLLYGAQDAALVLCDHVSGSQTEFVALMNQYAAELGMENTEYKNALGAYAQGQTTTASDLALLTQAVLKNDALRDMLAKSRYDTANGRTVRNRLEIMREDSTGYDARVRGIGAGSTSSAGTNILLYFVDNDQGMLFIGHTGIDDQSGSANNAKSIFDHCLSAYGRVDVTPAIQALLSGSRIPLPGGEQAVIPAPSLTSHIVFAEKGIASTLADPEAAAFTLGELPALAAAPQAGEEIGTVALQYQGRGVLEIPLVASAVQSPEEAEAQAVAVQSNGKSIPLYSAEDWQGLKKEQTVLSRYGFFIVTGAAILLAIAVLVTVKLLYRKKR